MSGDRHPDPVTLPAAEAPRDAAHWPPGDRYERAELVGRGASKLVFRAHDTLLDRQVAISLIAVAGAGSAQRERLVREVRTTARLGDHPHILTVHDVGDDAETVWFVAQYVAGGSLADLLAGHPAGLPVDDAVRIARQVADALACAHRHDVVHRDVKPGNVLLDGERAVLADFGVALLSGQSRVTHEGAVVGTPCYMSPEQARGEAVDARSDLYALGAMLFELLTGSPPFQGSALSVIARHAATPPPDLRERGIAPPLAQLVAELLSKRASDRPASAADVRDRLAALTATPADAPAAGAGPLHEGLPIIGRDDERAALHGLLAEGLHDGPRWALLIGDAGIGKSRLIRDLAEQAGQWGAQVLWGECLAISGGSLPYAPVAGALRSAPAAELAAAVAALPESGRVELALAFPDIAVHAPEPAHESSAREVSQERLFAWLHSLLRNLLGGGPGLLVLEDFHWADASSRAFVEYLVHTMRDVRLTVAVSLRDENPEIRRLLATLPHDRVKRLELAPFGRPQVEAQATRLLGHAPPRPLVDELLARGQGNPLLTEALLAAEDGELPAQVEDALLAPIQALTPDARDVVRAVAVIGRPVEPDVVTAWPGLAPDALLRGLREAIEHRVLVSEAGSERFDFRHALVRESVYQRDLNAAERLALHAAAAEAIEAGGDAPAPGELARHWEASHRWARALAASYEAGTADGARFGHAGALEHFERALRLWDRCRPAAGELEFDRVDILARAAESARWTGDFERALGLCHDALAAVDEGADPRRAAALYERLGRYRPWNADASREAYARALALLPPATRAERARVLAEDALTVSWDFRFAEAKSLAAAVLASDGEIPRPVAATARGVLGVAHGFTGDPAAGAHELRSALATAEAAGAVEEAATLTLQLADVVRIAGRREDALALMRDGAAAASEKGAEAFARFMRLNAAEDLFVLGRWDEAERVLARISRSELSHTGRLLLTIINGRLAAATGRFDEADACLQDAEALAVEDPPPPDFELARHRARAELELWRGRPEVARDAVAAALEALGDRDDPLHAPEVLSLGCSAWAGSVESTGRPEDAGARALIAHLQRLAALAREPGALPAVDAHLALAQAELTRLAGAASPEAWSGVAAAWRALGQLPQLVYAGLRETEAWLRTPNGAARAATAARAACAGAAPLADGPLRRQVEAIARVAAEACDGDAGERRPTD